MRRGSLKLWLSHSNRYLAWGEAHSNDDLATPRVGREGISIGKDIGIFPRAHGSKDTFHYDYRSQHHDQYKHGKLILFEIFLKNLLVILKSIQEALVYVSYLEILWYS